MQSALSWCLSARVSNEWAWKLSSGRVIAQLYNVHGDVTPIGCSSISEPIKVITTHQTSRDTRDITL